MDIRPMQGHGKKADERAMGVQVLPGRQETRGAGIIQLEITETEMHWVPFAEMN